MERAVERHRRYHRDASRSAASRRLHAAPFFAVNCFQPTRLWQSNPLRAAVQ